MKCAFSVTQLCKIYRKCFQIYFHLEEKLNKKVFVLPRVETHVRQCSSSTIKTDTIYCLEYVVIYFNKVYSL